MQPPLMSDADLVAACLEGDTRSWDVLVLRYQGLIMAIAHRMGVTAPDAEDVFQEVCVKLYGNLGSLRNAERVSSWLAAVTRQEVWRAGRKRRVTSMSDLGTHGEDSSPLDELTVDQAPSPEEELLAIEERHIVRVCMQHLCPECRELLTLLYADDPPPSYAELAQRLNRPIGSIGPTRGRCLVQLRKLLDDFGFR